MDLAFSPLGPVWLWYCIRSGSYWFFTAANPNITFGGYKGEGKMESYDQLPKGTYPMTLLIKPRSNLESVLERVRESGIQYPLVVKPDIGMKALMFRKIDHSEHLALYHRTMTVDYLIQEYVAHPNEGSLFYYRHPNDDHGKISGFCRKESPVVMGDGHSTLEQLIGQHPEVRYRPEKILNAHRGRLDEVLPKGEEFVLSDAANRLTGGKLTNLKNEIDESLMTVFDNISKHAGYYYGRYDIKYNSVEELKRGESFSILEFNGCGAGPQHMYHSGLNLFQGIGVLFQHWQAMFRIARAHRKLGVKKWKFNDGWRFLQMSKKHMKLLKQLEEQLTF